MYVTGIIACDLFVYSPIKNGSCTIRAHCDKAFIKRVILVGKSFYFEHYLRALYLENTGAIDESNNRKKQFKRYFTDKQM